MLNKVVLSLLLICLVTSVRSQCALTSLLLATCLATNPCVLSTTLLNTLCPLTTNLAISLSSSATINIDAPAINGLSVAATGSATATVNIAAVVTIANDLALAAGAVVSVAKGAVVTINGNVNVAAGATLQVAGNVTTAGTVAVNGNLRLAGDVVRTTAQTAWIKSTNAAKSISVSGSASAAATITGNGGIDASVVCEANVNVSIGNSPGVVYINGDLTMSSTTTLEIDVARDSNDYLLISGRFKRNGILYCDFENNYRPNNGQSFLIASHTSDDGDFNIARGNFDETLNKVNPKYGTLQTSFTYGSAATVALPVVLMVLCIMGLVF